MSVYEFKAKLNSGQEVSLKEYQGKVLLVVNTASACGFTPQYAELEELYLKYKDQGFEVLAFPCNQFGSQEKGSDEQIRSFCDLTFNISFPLFSKIEVNGMGAHPLYKYLTQEQKGLMGSKNIKWNFTKFLIDKTGTPIARYASMTKPKSLEKEIERLLDL